RASGYSAAPIPGGARRAPRTGGSPMSMSLPRLTPTGRAIKVTCRMPADLHADLEAYAAAYQRHYGEAIALPALLMAILRDYLSKDRTFLRWRQEHEAQLGRGEEPRGTARRGTEGTEA